MSYNPQVEFCYGILPYGWPIANSWTVSFRGVVSIEKNVINVFLQQIDKLLT